MAKNNPEVKVINYNYRMRTPVQMLNLSNCGGVSPGLIEIYGGSRSGKSSFCYQTAEYLLEDLPTQSQILILDAEGAVNDLRLKVAFNLKTDGSDPRISVEPAMTIEMANESIIKWIAKCKEENKVLLVIWDSISASSFNKEKETTESSVNNEKETAERGMTAPMVRAAILKWCLNNILHASYRQPVFVFLINQLTTKVVGFNVSTDSSGGYALRHNVNERYHLEYSKPIGGEEKNSLFRSGTLSKLTVVKSRSIPGFKDIPITIDDTVGGKIMPENELPLIAPKLSLLTMKNGGWYSIPDEFMPDNATEEMKKPRQMKDIIGNQDYNSFLGQAVIKFLRKEFKLIDYMYKEQI